MSFSTLPNMFRTMTVLKHEFAGLSSVLVKTVKAEQFLYHSKI